MASCAEYQPARAEKRSRVAYYYDPSIGNFYYGQGHPMKPHRIRMAHNLVLNYGLYQQMECFRPHHSSFLELSRFHSDDYIKFLQNIRPGNMRDFSRLLQQFNVGEVRYSGRSFGSTVW